MTDDVEMLADEQAADLARLRAAAMEGEPAPISGELAEAAAPDPVAETAAMLGAVVALASPLLPYLPTIYTPETVQALAGAYVPVAEKHGWNVGGWLDRYAAELALVAVAGPVAIRTATAHKAWKAERAAEARAKKGEPAPAPSQGGDRPAVVAGTVQAPEPEPAQPGAVAFEARAA